MGLGLGLLPAEGFQLIVAGALLSIAINPFLFRAIEPLEARLRDVGILRRLGERGGAGLATLDAATEDGLRQHAVICGYGRVGQLIGPALERRGFRYVVVTQQRDEIDRLRARGIAAIYGDPAQPEILDHAHVERARLVVVATADPHETRRIVEQVRERSPRSTSSCAPTATSRLPGCGPSRPRSRRSTASASWPCRWPAMRCAASGSARPRPKSIAQGLRVRPARSQDEVLPAAGRRQPPWAAITRWLERRRVRGPGEGETPVA